MANPHWPLFDLRIVTPRLELRYPSDDNLFALAAILAEGIHDPETMPFSEPWTRAESPELERNGLRFWWSRRGALLPDNWTLPFAVFEHGDLVGVQDVFAKHFATTRTVTTGSWLVQRAQGHGIGKEMRAAVLHFAFAGLSAVEAYTDAFEDNPASLGVDAGARLRVEWIASARARRRFGEGSRVRAATPRNGKRNAAPTSRSSVSPTACRCSVPRATTTSRGSPAGRPDCRSRGPRSGGGTRWTCRCCRRSR